MEPQIRYKPIVCYGCGKPFSAYTSTGVHRILIDGVWHDVNMRALPCCRCESCDITVYGPGFDEAWCEELERYKNERGINTVFHKLYRWGRRKVLVVRDRWNLWRVRRVVVR